MCWLVIDGWFIVVRKPYFELEFMQCLAEFFKDVIFGTTFPGSWYLSASVMGVIIVYSLSKVLNRYIVFLITLLIALYVFHADQLSQPMQLPYEWYATHIREEVNLSFPAQMVWISLGQIISYWLTKMENNKHKLMLPSIGFFIVTFFAQIFYPSLLFTLVMTFVLFTFCFLIELPDSQIYKRLRNYSILIFFFHFSIAGKMGLFCRLLGDTLVTNWLYYILVVAISIVFAETILRLEKYKYLKFLRYTH